VAALKASLKPQATCKRDGKWQNMDAGGLVPGDLVLLAAGSSVPADCLLNGGRLEIVQSALTGESLPVTMYKGDSAKMGSTVTRGETEGTVEVREGEGKEAGLGARGGQGVHGNKQEQLACLS
jgi:H+-transporting ATPase